jgi:hypothetical protein
MLASVNLVRLIETHLRSIGRDLVSIQIDRLIRSGVWYRGIVELGVHLHGRVKLSSDSCHLSVSFYASSGDKNAGVDQLRLIRL